MTMNQLQCFVAVAKELSFSKAAKSLFLSTSAVSRQIKLLEEDLDVELLHRDQTGVRLTIAGAQFYPEAADILERVSLSRQGLLNQPGRETLYLGFASSLSVMNLSSIYRIYKQEMPHVIVNNSVLSQYAYHLSSQADRIDVYFIPNELTHSESFIKESQEYVTLQKSHLSCVVPKGHRLESRNSVGIQDLIGETLILLDHEHSSPSMDEVQMEIRRFGKNLTYFYSGSSFFTAPMIEGGLGIAVMPDFVCPQTDQLVKIPYQSNQQWEFGLVYRKHDTSEKVLKFVDVAKRVFAVSA